MRAADNTHSAYTQTMAPSKRTLDLGLYKHLADTENGTPVYPSYMQLPHAAELLPYPCPQTYNH